MSLETIALIGWGVAFLHTLASLVRAVRDGCAFGGFTAVVAIISCVWLIYRIGSGAFV